MVALEPLDSDGAQLRQAAQVGIVGELLAQPLNHTLGGSPKVLGRKHARIGIARSKVEFARHALRIDSKQVQ